MLALFLILPLAGVVVFNLPAAFLRRAVVPFGVAFAAMQALAVMFGRLESFSCALLPLSADGLSLVMLLAIALVALAALLTGRAAIGDEKLRFNFANLVLLATAGMNGIVLCSDLFTVYVFLEITAVSSFIMIASGQTREGLEGAFKYFVLSAAASVAMLTAVALLLLETGATGFAGVAEALREDTLRPLSMLAMVLFLGGLFVKSGVMPFHGWVPDAYSSAPPAVSVLLAGIVTKTTGVYVLIRLVTDVFGFGFHMREMTMLVGTVTLVAAALAAMAQNDMKRMLAYSSISQVGYIVLGFGLGTPLGLAGAVFHLFNHSVFKSLLFVNAAAVERQAGTRLMGSLGGLSVRMPLTGASSVIGLLSTAGVPPLAGFWSKLVIVVALWQAGYVAYAIIAIMASLLTLAYFLIMQRRVFFGLLRPGLEKVREDWALSAPTILLAAITVGVGLLIPFIAGTFLLPI